MNTPFLAIQVDFGEKGPIRFLFHCWYCIPGAKSNRRHHQSVYISRERRTSLCPPADLVRLWLVSSFWERKNRSFSFSSSLFQFDCLLSHSLSRLFLCTVISLSPVHPPIYIQLPLSPSDSTVWTSFGSILTVYGLTQPFKLWPPPFPGRMAQREMNEGREMDFHVIGNFQVSIRCCWPTKPEHPIAHCPASSTRTIYVSLMGDNVSNEWRVVGLRFHLWQLIRSSWDVT